MTLETSAVGNCTNLPGRRPGSGWMGVRAQRFLQALSIRNVSIAQTKYLRAGATLSATNRAPRAAAKDLGWAGAWVGGLQGWMRRIGAMAGFRGGGWT